MKNPAEAPENEASHQPPSPPKLAWTGKTRGGYLGNWILILVLKHLGLRAAYLLLFPLCFYFLFFAPTALRASLDYQKRRFKTPWFIRLLNAYRHFYSFGQLLLDRMAIPIRMNRFRVEEINLSYILDAARQKKGLVLLGAHVGGWEGAMAFLARNDVPVNVVMFEGEVGKVRQLMEKAVRVDKVKFLGVSGSPQDSFKVTAALRNGEVVAMHGDRTLGGRSIAIPFLGAPTQFPLWPYALAAASKAPLIHTFAARTGIYRYRFQAWPSVYPSLDRSGGEKEPLRKFAEGFVANLEEFVKDYPYQWFNFYPFWEQQ